MGCQEKRGVLLMAWSTECACNLVGSGLVLDTSERIQGRSDTSSIELNVERSDIKVVRELRETINEIGRGKGDGDGNVKAEFVNTPQLRTLSWQVAGEESGEYKEEIHVETSFRKVRRCALIALSDERTIRGNFSWEIKKKLSELRIRKEHHV